MHPSSFQVRPGQETDLAALVHLHVSSWNATYPDYHPKPTTTTREHQWQQLFSTKPNNWFCYVVLTDNGELAGFATGHNFVDENLPYRGQLDKIHFYKKYQRLGLGTRLVGCVVNHFLRNNINSMILFADPANPNIAFYDKLKGERLPNENGVFQGAFGWKNLNILAHSLQFI